MEKPRSDVKFLSQLNLPKLSQVSLGLLLPCPNEMSEGLVGLDSGGRGSGIAVSLRSVGAA